MALPLVGRRQPQAGRRAEARYRELLATWQRRVLPQFRWILWPAVVLGVVGVALPGHWDWTAGFIAGGAFAAWSLVRDDAPKHIDNWRVGAEGERNTEKCLEVLRRKGWYGAHDLPHGTGNIDHVVIGPAGMFVLDSKVWSGTVTVDEDGVPTVTPRDNPDAAWSAVGLPRHLRRMGAEVKDEVRRSTHIVRWVQPVAVLWSPFPDGVKESGGLVFVQGDELLSWLETLPTSCSPEEQRRLRHVIDALIESSAHPEPRMGSQNALP